MIALPKHKLRCVDPYGDVWSSFGLRGASKLPELKKHDFFEDKNLLNHTKNYQNYYFLLQCGGLSIEIGAKVHMDTSAIHRRPQGAPK